MGPVDTRRLPGPEKSRDWRSYCGSHGHLKKLRIDRKPEDHRDLFLKVGVVGRASGSAYLEQGRTKVIAGVYGPREIPKRSDFSIKGVVSARLDRCPFSSPHRRGWTGGDPEGEMSKILTEALETTICLQNYPKTQIDVFVQVLEDDGGVLGAALTVASLALANASIQMYDLIIGASLKRRGPVRLVDPCLAEETASEADEDHGRLTIGYQPSAEQLACVLQDGNVSTAVLTDDIQHLTKIATGILPNVQKCLIDFVQASLKSKSKNNDS